MEKHVNFPDTLLHLIKESAYLELLFSSVLDGISNINPYLSTPFLEIEDMEGGVYRVEILVHIQQPKETKHVENEL